MRSEAISTYATLREEWLNACRTTQELRTATFRGHRFNLSELIACQQAFSKILIDENRTSEALHEIEIVLDFLLQGKEQPPPNTLQLLAAYAETADSVPVRYEDIVSATLKWWGIDATVSASSSRSHHRLFLKRTAWSGRSGAIRYVYVVPLNEVTC